MDAKATVKIGSFSRGGKSRVSRFACDHDYQPKSKLTPYGIFLPELDELFMYFTSSKVTADFIVDVLEQWWISVKTRFNQIRTLLINQDNGGENSFGRTQFMKRLVEFAHRHQLHIRLAYYPPYHSKFERRQEAEGRGQKDRLVGDSDSPLIVDHQIDVILDSFAGRAFSFY